MGLSAEELLSWLAAGEQSSAQKVMALGPAWIQEADASDFSLIPRVRMLVRLAALIAADASTTTLRWAVERACCAGADEADIVRVLVTVSPVMGSGCVVATAPRLALAIGHELEVDGWDGS